MTTRRRILGGLALAQAGVVSRMTLGGAQAAEASQTPLVEPFVALDDPAIRVIENVYIPMPDGARLAARMFLPSASTVAPCGAVLEYLPYRKRDGYRYRDDVAGAGLAKRGVALVRVDIRGTGDSDGVMVDEYEPVEQADVVSVLRWIAHQPWCNGAVGMRGISYGSFTGLQAASRSLPELKAVVSACGTEQRYLDDVHYRGGCLIDDQWTWAMEWQVVLRAPPDPKIVGEDNWRRMWKERLEASGPLSINWNEHQTDDALWRYGSTQDYSQIKAAIFHVAGMLDSYLPSATRLMERAPQAPQMALIGPWAHKWPGYAMPAGHKGFPTDAHDGAPGPGVDWLPLEARWWRHWLNGEQNGVMDGPRFYAFRQDAPSGFAYPKDTPGAFVAEPSWPSPRVRPLRFWLNAEGLQAEPKTGSWMQHQTNLTLGFANRTSDSSGAPGDWWREQSRDDALSLCFDSAVLTAPVDLIGEPMLKVRVRSDKPVAKVYARLTEVTPDGHSHFVSYALLNLTHRDSHENPTPLEPGRDYDVTLKGQFACYRFAAGSKIRLALSETWWPVVWPSPERVTLQFATGLCSLTLPTRPGGAPDVLPFALMRGAYDQPGVARAPYWEPMDGVHISGAEGQRLFVLEEGSKTVEETFVPGAETYYGEAYWLRRTIREDDPNSAEMEAEAVNTLRRGDWNIRLHAWSKGRSTVDSLICEESFEAWEGTKQVFARRWTRTIPRNLL